MIIYDVKELARNLVMSNSEGPEVREHLVRTMLCGALEIFNDPHRENTVITELQDVLENDYEVLGSEEIVLSVVTELRNRAKTCGWDPRTKAKIDYRAIGKGVIQAMVVMDLDETLARILDSGAIESSLEHVTDIVSDHPDMEVLNELNRLHSNETERRTPLLSDRSPAFVQEPERPGWRVSDWERFGRS